MVKTINQLSLTLEAAQFIGQAAIQSAMETGFKMNVVVVDIAGNPLVSYRMPGAPLPALDFAEKKAYTAVSYGHETAKWTDILANRPVITAGLAQHPNVAMFGGGQPIFVDGHLVGGVGLAGGKAQDDDVCAKAAVDAFQQLMSDGV